jgi:hypothetical protein
MQKSAGHDKLAVHYAKYATFYGHKNAFKHYWLSWDSLQFDDLIEK